MNASKVVEYYSKVSAVTQSFRAKIQFLFAHIRNDSAMTKPNLK